MAENDDQERTEDATARRREQAKEKGQVARSKELASAAVMVVGSLALMFLGDSLARVIVQMMQSIFTLSKEEIFDVSSMGIKVFDSLINIFYPIIIILIVFFIASFLGASGLGGISFSFEAARPKLSKLSPLAGLKRMFSTQSLVELIKSILKVALVSGVAMYLLKANLNDLYQLSIEPFPINFYHALKLIINFIFLICCSLLIVVVIDVPFQIWQHNEQLKMTKQEVKDEFKEMEGKPEVKGRIRMLQREMAQRSMMEEIPTANVIIANPEHFSVALRYDSAIDKAPVVVAKGVDFVALKIREIGAKYDVQIVSAPPLARALYHSTELEQQIPDGLFLSVAQVLAYVYSLNEYKKGKGPKPGSISNLSIPPEFRY